MCKHISIGTMEQFQSFLKTLCNIMSHLFHAITMEGGKMQKGNSKERCDSPCNLWRRMPQTYTGRSRKAVEHFSIEEKADTWMCLCAANVTGFGYEAIIISSIDTYIRVLYLAFCTEIPTPIFQKCRTENCTSMWISVKQLWLLVLHAYTGCDSIHAFAGKCKLSAWRIVW